MEVQISDLMFQNTKLRRKATTLDILREEKGSLKKVARHIEPLSAIKEAYARQCSQELQALASDDPATSPEAAREGKKPSALGSGSQGRRQQKLRKSGLGRRQKTVDFGDLGDAGAQSPKCGSSEELGLGLGRRQKTLDFGDLGERWEEPGMGLGRRQKTVDFGDLGERWEEPGLGLGRRQKTVDFGDLGERWEEPGMGLGRRQKTVDFGDLGDAGAHSSGPESSRWEEPGFRRQKTVDFCVLDDEGAQSSGPEASRWEEPGLGGRQKTVDLGLLAVADPGHGSSRGVSPGCERWGRKKSLGLRRQKTLDLGDLQELSPRPGRRGKKSAAGGKDPSPGLGRRQKTTDFWDTGGAKGLRRSGSDPALRPDGPLKTVDLGGSKSAGGPAPVHCAASGGIECLGSRGGAPALGVTTHLGGHENGALTALAALAAAVTVDDLHPPAPQLAPCVASPSVGTDAAVASSSNKGTAAPAPATDAAAASSAHGAAAFRTGGTAGAHAVVEPPREPTAATANADGAAASATEVMPAPTAHSSVTCTSDGPRPPPSGTATPAPDAATAVTNGAAPCKPDDAHAPIPKVDESAASATNTSKALARDCTAAPVAGAAAAPAVSTPDVASAPTINGSATPAQVPDAVAVPATDGAAALTTDATAATAVTDGTSSPDLVAAPAAPETSSRTDAPSDVGAAYSLDVVAAPAAADTNPPTAAPVSAAADASEAPTTDVIVTTSAEGAGPADVTAALATDRTVIPAPQAREDPVAPDATAEIPAHAASAFPADCIVSPSVAEITPFHGSASIVATAVAASATSAAIVAGAVPLSATAGAATLARTPAAHLAARTDTPASPTGAPPAAIAPPTQQSPAAATAPPHAPTDGQPEPPGPSPAARAPPGAVTGDGRPPPATEAAATTPAHATATSAAKDPAADTIAAQSRAPRERDLGSILAEVSAGNMGPQVEHGPQGPPDAAPAAEPCVASPAPDPKPKAKPRRFHDPRTHVQARPTASRDGSNDNSPTASDLRSSQSSPKVSPGRGHAPRGIQRVPRPCQLPGNQPPAAAAESPGKAAANRPKLKPFKCGRLVPAPDPAPLDWTKASLNFAAQTRSKFVYLGLDCL